LAVTSVETASGSQGLPRCSDPHDQKFLELALASGADILVTKDQALLELARRKLPFRIAAPNALGAL
jgi:predicted nucleic acid-binding protein